MLLALGLCAALLSIGGCANNARSSFYTGSMPNVGPCPSALALSDTARLVEINGPELYSNVGFTGEILKAQAWCRYFEDQPISIELQVEFALGRGPAAKSNYRDYEWFVAVTRRNTAVAASERFAFGIEFPDDQNIIRHTENLDNIFIPRAYESLSGSNFEIIVGFMLTEEQLDFNQSGKRFRVDAGRAKRR